MEYRDGYQPLSPYDVELRYVRTQAGMERRLKNFTRDLKAIGGKVTDSYWHGPYDTILVRAHMNDAILRKACEWKTIYSVRRPPKPQLGMINMIEDEEEDEEEVVKEE